METPDNEVHYFAIVNSLMIGFLLCGTVAIIMIRALRKDINRYNEFDIDDYNTPVEESGWKLVHSDVFRPPKKGRTLLSVAVVALQRGMDGEAHVGGGGGGVNIDGTAHGCDKKHGWNKLTEHAPMGNVG